MRTALYVVSNPLRGHRQLKGSASNGTRHHNGRPEVEEVLPPVKRFSHADCNTSEPVVTRTPFGLQTETYCFTHMEHVYGFAGG